MARISGNSCDRHFSVVSLDRNLENIDLLVNTTESFTGVVLIDIARDNTTTGFEINSNCEWSIEFLPLSAARLLTNGMKMTGFGTDVIAVQNGGVMTINGNADSRYFGARGYGGGGAYLDLLVNTTDPYSGNVRVEGGTRYIQVDTSSKSQWSLQYP